MQIRDIENLEKLIGPVTNFISTPMSFYPDSARVAEPNPARIVFPLHFQSLKNRKKAKKC
jgi:hypothetical protein